MKYQLTASNNTSVTVNLDKGQSGWKGETQIELGDNRVLFITTSKLSSSGALRTTAMVGTVDGFSVRYVMGFGKTGDFHAVLASTQTRVTEKAVREQHQHVLTAACGLTDLLARVQSHYAAQAQLRENKATSEVAHA
jgi:hypothetical protein